MKNTKLFLCFIGLLAFAIGPAVAGEETLPYTLVTKVVGELVHDDPAIEGLALGAGQAVGVAYFEDGRIAAKEYVFLRFAGEKTPWPLPGFSNYVFQNGDSLQLSFTYGPTDEGVSVDYTILSGTGAYSGATGDGRLLRVKAAWKDAILWKGSLRVVTP